MVTLLVIIFLLSVIAFIISLINPKWIVYLPFKYRTRKKGALISFVISVILFFAVGIVTSITEHKHSIDKPNQKTVTKKDANTSTNQPEKKEVHKPVDARTAIKNTIKYTKYVTSVSINDNYGNLPGKYIVLVHSNLSDIQYGNTKEIFHKYANELFEKAYKSNKDIAEMTIFIDGTMQDSNGNKITDTMMKLTIEGNSAKNMNWNYPTYDNEWMIPPLR